MNGMTVVLGIGNTLLSDEGVGVHVMSQLRDSGLSLNNIEYLDGGTLSFTLAVPMADAENLLIVDAAELKSSPGSVKVFEDDAMDEYLNSGPRRSVHEVGLIDLMAVIRLSDRLPKRRALIGIQPEKVDWGEEPSEAVAKAIPYACEEAKRILESWNR